MKFANLKLLTLDLTGMVLRFKEPVFRNYAEIASLYKIQVEESEIKSSFLKSWSRMNKSKPHFGSTCQVSSEEWWNEVVHRTFKGCMGNSYRVETIQPLAAHLYKHYEMAGPYHLFSDAMEFLQRTRRLQADTG